MFVDWTQDANPAPLWDVGVRRLRLHGRFWRPRAWTVSTADRVLRALGYDVVSVSGRRDVRLAGSTVLQGSSSSEFVRHARRRYEASVHQCKSLTMH